MADFRKSLLTLVGTLTLGALSASAQGPAPALSCVLSGGGNPLARSEGITEITGDIVIQCTGGTPTPAGTPIPQVNIRVFLNTSVTSRLLTGSVSEALLLLDEPTNNPQNTTFETCNSAPVPCTNLGNGAGLPLYGAGSVGAANKNVFQGSIPSSNSVEWLGVPIDPPGTTGTRTIRITNIRANANALGGGSTSGIPVGIVAVLTSSNSQTLPIQTPTLTIASILKSLDFTVGSPAVKSLQQCFSQSNTNVGTLNYRELFPTAFRKYNVGSSAANPTLAVAQTTYQTPQNLLNAISTETVFYQPTFTSPYTTSAGSAGLPNFGTRLKAVFANIPAGVSLAVSTTSTATQSGSNTPIEVAHLVTSETGVYTAAGSGSISLTGGTGVAVWEIVEANGSANTTLSFTVTASYTADPGNNIPALGTGTVAGSYAPISTVTTASSSAPIPRFADTGDARNLLTIVPCVTNLLFPFVTNQVGFDTGLAISSTSTDPFGTSPQSGICKLYWYGANAPAVTDTPVVQSGTSWVGLTSSLAPNFQGYMIAVCRFQYAHGFAFVSDFGAQNIAMGYLALIIPDPATPRHAAPGVCGGTGSTGLALSGCLFSGEQLSN